MRVSLFQLQFSYILFLSFSLANGVKSASFSGHEHERIALLQFRQSFLTNCDLSPASDIPKLQWDIARRRSGGCCTWDGVMCNNETGYVTELDLSSSCLYGTFPSNSSLFDLRYLESLNLAYNDFNHSQIPRGLGHLEKLTTLNLSGSSFSGQIPQEISQLSSLRILDLSYNVDPSSGNPLLQLHEPSLETLVVNLTRLEQLDLDQVDISSPVSTVILNLTSLRFISLTYCNLNGEFPNSFFHLPKLESVYLSGNTDLQGFLPEFLQNSPLKDLQLFLTGFSGKLPPSIGYLVSLEALNLWNCNFSGPIPSAIGNLTKLSVLNLGRNQLTGYLPISITNITHLNALQISKIKFRHSEDLVTWLEKLNKLTVLSLRDTGLVGEIPISVKNLTKMTYLDLSVNGLSGHVPSWLGNLTLLTDLYLDANQLSGSIPPEIAQLASLGALGLSENKDLSGDFSTFLELKKLTTLQLSGVDLKFPVTTSTNDSFSVKFNILSLEYCNLTEFPLFLDKQDEITYLSLSGNEIQGSVPQWFLNTSKENLLLLDLSNNLLQGFEHPIVDLPWSFLEVLDLSGNRFEGSLPNPSSSMLVYQVSNNHFTGSFPKQICKASSMNVLDLSNNSMHGQIPGCLTDQVGSSLLALNLRDNDFNGTFPLNFRQSCQLKMINLGENKLEGKLPRSLSNCQMLEVLDVGDNLINDTFPSWLGSLSNLEVLVLRRNRFHGRIASPRAGFVFPSMRIIDLSKNFHTGDIPSAYFRQWNVMKMYEEDQGLLSSSEGTSITVNFVISGVPYARDEQFNYVITITNKGNEMLYPTILNVFRVIDFSSNKFNGKIPGSIGDLQGLQALNFSNNNLDGGIPSSLSKMKGLESLDFSQNMLTGEISQELMQLSSLAVFNVSHNNLVGQIPQGQQFSTFDRSSYEGNLGLCGSPLPKECFSIDNSPSPTLQTTNDHEKVEDSKLVDWIVRVSGCVSGIITGFIVGKIYVTDVYHDWFVETFARKRRHTFARKRRHT